MAQSTIRMAQAANNVGIAWATLFGGFETLSKAL
jgi:hypothetical protein